MAERGRPTKYNTKMNEQVYKLCLLGATDEQIADFFEVHVDTINNWKKSEPDFLESLRRGKDQADMEVAHCLYKRATGYEYDNVKVFQFQGEPVIVPVVEKIAPDITAQIFWLKNRRRNQWRNMPAEVVEKKLELEKEKFEHVKKQDAVKNF